MATAFGPLKWARLITRERVIRFSILKNLRLFRSIAVFFAQFAPFFLISVAGAAGVLLLF